MLEKANITYDILEGIYEKTNQSYFVVALFPEVYDKFVDSGFSSIMVNMNDV